MLSERLWLVSCVALSVACGSSPGPVTPKSQTTGTVGGAPLANPEVLMVELNGDHDWVGTIRVIITEATGSCDLIKNNQARASKASVVLVMTNGKGDTLHDGTYPVITGFAPEGTGNYATGFLSKTADGCSETLSGDGAQFASGEIKLTSYAERVSVEGTFDVTVGGQKVTGSFAANSCAGVTQANLDAPDACL